MAPKKTFQRRPKCTVLIKKVNDANMLKDPLEFLPLLRAYVLPEITYIFECKRLVDCDQDIVQWVFRLEEENMKHMYELSEWGWNVKKKESEMFHKLNWHLFVKDCRCNYVGFARFGFDMDYGSVVLYCHSVQIEKKSRRIGLGRHLMTVLERIAESNDMEKIIFTVLKINREALKFFFSLGYEKDETSPDKVDKNCFYGLLSKSTINDKILEDVEMETVSEDVEMETVVDEKGKFVKRKACSGKRNVFDAPKKKRA